MRKFIDQKVDIWLILGLDHAHDVWTDNASC